MALISFNILLGINLTKFEILNSTIYLSYKSKSNIIDRNTTRDYVRRIKYLF